MAIFNSNDSVRMCDAIVNPYRGQVGRIVGIKRDVRNKEILDKYWVRFDDGNTVEVWGLQLEIVQSHRTLPPLAKVSRST